MYAIAFDMVVKKILEYFDYSYQGYNEIEAVMKQHGFEWKQGSLYVTNDENMATLFNVMTDLRSRKWFVNSVRDIRAFRIEQWSDFTPVMKSVSENTAIQNKSD